ncbi:MAG TPA: DNA primase small subunit domain-containing protein [Nitrososphaeraceae archaeon]|jgi:DNA primase small subunit
MNILKSSDLILVRNAFREYYFKYNSQVETPSRINEREFGLMSFQTGMIRHLSFDNIRQVHATLLKDTPFDFYCSNAFYNSPASPMQEKGWKGADLIFDIDAKDLALPCEASHRYQMCANCDEIINSAALPCKKCKNSTLRVESIPCNNCFLNLRREVNKLIAILTEEIGIEYDNISIYFSGNSGFHLYVDDLAFRNLDSRARSDLAGYILGNGIGPQVLGVRNGLNNTVNIKFPKTGFKYGWGKRLAKKLRVEQTSSLKLTRYIEKLGGFEAFSKYLINYAKEIGIKIDPHVTIDIHRIFRHAGSLNGKSGLSKLRCRDLDHFDPLSEACLLNDNEVQVQVRPSNLKFQLKGRTFTVSQKKVRLPTYAAVYLICKGLATTVFPEKS